MNFTTYVSKKCVTQTTRATQDITLPLNRNRTRIMVKNFATIVNEKWDSRKDRATRNNTLPTN